VRRGEFALMAAVWIVNFSPPSYVRHIENTSVDIRRERRFRQQRKILLDRQTAQVQPVPLAFVSRRIGVALDRLEGPQERPSHAVVTLIALGIVQIVRVARMASFPPVVGDYLVEIAISDV